MAVDANPSWIPGDVGTGSSCTARRASLVACLIALAGCGAPPAPLATPGSAPTTATDAGDAEVRKWLDALRAAGPDGEATESPEASTLAADAIDAIGPAAVAPLARALRDDPAWHVREFAAFALGRQGGHAVPAVPALLQGLRDENFLVTEACDGTLGTIADTGSAGLDAVAAGLASDDPAIRTAVAELLGAVGPSAAAALPRLERLARDDADATVRATAAEAAAAIGRDR